MPDLFPGIRDVFHLLDGTPICLIRQHAWYVLRDRYELSGRAIDWARQNDRLSDVDLTNLSACAERLRAFLARLARYGVTWQQYGPSPSDSYFYLDGERAEDVYAREWP